MVSFLAEAMNKKQIRKIGLILAGGQAKRFGGGKCEAVLGHSPLINWVYQAVRPLVDEIWLSTKKGYSFKDLSFEEIIEDPVPFEGPARALERILRPLSEGHKMLVVACDQPFLRPRLLRFLFEEAQKGDWWAVICQGRDGKWRPLPGVYSPGLKWGKSFKELSPREKVLVLPPSLWEPYDPEGLSFFNINYQKDLEQAQEKLKRARKGSPL